MCALRTMFECSSTRQYFKEASEDLFGAIGHSGSASSASLDLPEMRGSSRSQKLNKASRDVCYDVALRATRRIFKGNLTTHIVLGSAAIVSSLRR